MSVRKRTWENRDGSQGESWIVNYADQGGTRRMKSFELKRDADAFHATVNVDVRRGLHVPDSQSITVAEAAGLWLNSCTALERATRVQYQSHVDLHIVPLIGAVKLSQFTLPMARAFKDRLAKDRSPAMVRKVLTSLSSILADAQESGHVAQNVVAVLRSRRHRRGGGHDQNHGRKAIEIGVEIPTPKEIGALIAALDRNPHWRPLILTAALTGLRASELRGLPWKNVDLKRGELHVRQRADRYGVIGAPKTRAGRRTVPLPPRLVSILREWRLACPNSDLDLVFPSSRGGIRKLSGIVESDLIPAWVAAGVVTRTGAAKYTGMHALRHFYASWCINRKDDGGLELPAKMVQQRLGHASITITMDRYGHLFPLADDGSELAAAEKSLSR